MNSYIASAIEKSALDLLGEQTNAARLAQGGGGHVTSRSDFYQLHLVAIMSQAVGDVGGLPQGEWALARPDSDTLRHIFLQMLVKRRIPRCGTILVGPRQDVISW